MNDESIASSYDRVPYGNFSFAETHPERLSSVATLFGLSPAPIHHCRVLELGCASGGNLIPIAAAYPQSQFIGVDASERQIEEGNQVVSALKLKNISLMHCNISEVDHSLGQFDYIICHGVFSWVSRSIQRKILSIASGQLNEDGIAYISYNTYPGWHARDIAKHAMAYHTEQFEEPETKVQQAKSFFEFVSNSLKNSNSLYSKLIEREHELIKKKPDSYLLHEHLEEHNQPFYFHEFMKLAEEKGLRYVGDARFNGMTAEDFPEDVQQALRGLTTDIIRREQYSDFLRNRSFRRSLLCHSNREPDYKIHVERLRSFRISCSMTSASEFDPKTDEPVVFTHPRGSSVTLREPIVKAAFQILEVDWPSSVFFEDLIDRSRALIKREDDPALMRQDVELLATSCLRYFMLNMVEFHIAPDLFTTELSRKPTVNAISRFQLEKKGFITNLRHESIDPEGIVRHIAKLCDGRRSIKDLQKHLTKEAASGALFLERPDGVKKAPDPSLVEEILHKTLKQLAKSALLEPQQ